MNSELASLVVIVLIAVAAFFVYQTYVGAQKRKQEALTSPKKMTDWMAAQGFEPDHFSFFRGTGIALKDRDKHVVLYGNGIARFYPLTDITAVNAYESLDRGVPLGAAPGIVELNIAKRYNLDLTIRGLAKPFKILFANEDLVLQWESRLKTLFSTAKQFPLDLN